MIRRLGINELARFTKDRAMIVEQGGTGDETLDDSWFFADGLSNNVALECDGGCIPFVFMGYGMYDMHFLFPKEMRGERALRAARAMINEMFDWFDACRIYGTISRDHLAARWFIRQLGFAPVADSELAGAPAVTYAMDRATWLGLQPASTQ